MKLLCSSVTEDNAQLSQFLDSFKESLESNIFELLDNPDYPSYLRLKFLFESSFKALHECRALGDTSLLVIPPVNNKELRIIEADMPELGKNTQTQLIVTFVSEQHNMLWATSRQHFSPISVLLT